MLNERSLSFKNKDGREIAYPYEKHPTKRWDVKVRTEDKRVTYWRGGGKNFYLDEALKVWEDLKKMEVGYEPLCIQEF